MSSNRVTKKTIRNRSTAQALLVATSLFGAKGMPCSACFNANLVTPGSRVCVYSSASRRCGECMKRKVYCDGNDVGPALSASLDARFDMVEEEEKLEDEIISLQSKLLALHRRRRAQESRACALLSRGALSQEETDPSLRAPIPGPASQALEGSHLPSSFAAVGTPN
ncbi:hypothetical protein V8F33_014173 [Rhypophila sp. PSN 637]